MNTEHACTTVQPAVFWASWATRAQFLGLGTVAGVWGAHIPSVKRTYGLSEGSLSLLLLAIALGGVLALLVAGRVVKALGTRRTSQWMAIVVGASLALSLWWPNAWLVSIAMVIFGASMSLFDVAINTEGSTLEVVGQRHVMGNFHGNFSLGGMLGALLAGALMKWEIPANWQLVGVGVAVAVWTSLSAQGLQRVHLPSPNAQPSGLPVRAGSGHTLLLILGLLCFAGMSAEGAMYDWGVLYLYQEVGVSQARAAWGYAAFAGAMAIGRFTGDQIRHRYPEDTLLRVGGYTTATAMAGVLWFHNAWVAFAGFIVMGFGLSMVVPLLYNAASRVRGIDRASGIATVSAIGYLGFLFGPPVIGQLAEWTTLTWALALVVPMAWVLGWGTRFIPQPAPTVVVSAGPH